jgi:hypothetical protein
MNASIATTPFAPSPSPARGARLARVLAISGAFAVARLLHLPLCPYALLSGQPCPGCGMSRAATALFKGDLARATELNPSALVTVPVAAILVLFFAASYVYDGRMRANAPVVRALGVGTIAVLTAVWIARAFGAFGGMVAV